VLYIICSSLQWNGSVQARTHASVLVETSDRHWSTLGLVDLHRQVCYFAPREVIFQPPGFIKLWCSRASIQPVYCVLSAQ
jgi:hypothetical protein